MAKETMEKRGLSRRLFINQSLATVGAVTILSQARAWPAWASEPVEGEVSRMGRIVIDPESKRTWVSWLHVDVSTREVETERGPTNVSDCVDQVLVKSKGKGRYGKPVDVSAGQPHAKLDPRLDARGGRAAVTWCAMDHESRQWQVYLTRCDDGVTWSAPMAAAGGERPALHPSLSLEPDTGRAWIAYEDWADNSIRLISHLGGSCSESIKLSESGKNYRPRVIVTRGDGKNQGAVAVVWDSYRDGQYDIYLRVVGADGSLGPELRATESPLWDCGADLAEDLDGNLWVTWVRASNELSETNALREVWVRFFDGERWLWPNLAPGAPDDNNGRLTGYQVNWHPKLLVDVHNRVHVCYRDGTDPIPPITGKVRIMTYQGDRWSEPRHVKVSRGRDAIHMIWDFSLAIDERGRVEGVWDSQYVKRMGFANKVSHVRPMMIPTRGAERVAVQGHDAPEKILPGWPTRPQQPCPAMERDGKTYSLLFGDTHTHSQTSDGADPPDFYYHFARDRVGLDFFALSDHDFTVSYTPGLEALIAFMPEQFSSDGFICFQAFEFSSQAKGHRVVVFEGGYKPTYSMVVPPANHSNTTGGLYSFLHRFGLAPDSRVLVTAHNMFNVGNDFTQFDPSLEPLYDVTSLHILAEKPLEEYRDLNAEADANRSAIALINGIDALTRMNPKRSVKNQWFTCWRQCLAAGLPLGAYGTSDTHAANAIGYVVAGLWVEERSRKAVFDAMFDRRSLAFDSALRSADMWNTRPERHAGRQAPPMCRAEIRFELDGHFMGERPRINAPPLARARVRTLEAADPVRAIVFIRDGEETHTAFNDGALEMTAEWRDDAFTPGPHHYYVRVEFTRGGTAFSTPVFANY